MDGLVLIRCRETNILADHRANSDLVNETLKTLGLLIPDDRPLGPHCKWFKLEMEKPHHRIDPRAGEQGEPSRSRLNYSYWGMKLLILEEAFGNPEKASFLSKFHDPRNPRERAGYWAGLCVFIFAVLAFAIAIASTAIAGITLKETKIANSIASAGSTSADHAFSSSSSLAAAMKGSTSSPVTIVACCSATTTGNSSIASTSPIFGLSTALNATTLPIVTETITATATVTATTTEDVTATIVVTPQDVTATIVVTPLGVASVASTN
jgi:hypothetical protein